LLFSFLKTQSKYLLFLRSRFPRCCCTYYILSGKETHAPLPDYYSECRVCFLEVAMFACVYTLFKGRVCVLEVAVFACVYTFFKGRVCFLEVAMFACVYTLFKGRVCVLEVAVFACV